MKKYTILALDIYFCKRVYVDEKQWLPARGPAIIATTHACTVFDPLLVAVRCKMQLHFLANYGLFKHPISNWLLSNLFCIPVQRPKDVFGQEINNDAAFAKSRAFLQKGGTLYVAPEGTSYAFRRVRPFKTGFARIALDAERAAGGKLGVVVVPVSIHYLDPFSFRSEVIVQYAPSIRVADYLLQFEKDAPAAVHTLTNDVAARIRNLHVHTDHETQDELARTWETIFLNEEREQRFDVLKIKKIQQSLTSAVTKLYNETPERFEYLRRQALSYEADLRRLKVDDFSLKYAKNLPAHDVFVSRLRFLLGFPCFLYGGIHHLGAFGLPYFIMKKMNLYCAYDSTIKGVAGVVMVPFFYFFQTFFMYKYTNNIYITILYFITLMPFGIFSVYFLDEWKKWRTIKRARRLWQEKPETTHQLWERRVGINQSISKINI